MVKEKKLESVGERTMSWIRSIVVALVLWFVLRTLLVGAFHITSGSMEDTLLVGDVLFVNKALYGAQIPLSNKQLPGFRRPRRFDVVVFESVEEQGLMIVKRLIGAPGDTIEMRDNFVFLNGEAVDEPYVLRYDESSDPADPKMRLWQRRYLVGKNAEQYRPTSEIGAHSWSRRIRFSQWATTETTPTIADIGDSWAGTASTDGRWWSIIAMTRTAFFLCHS